MCVIMQCLRVCVCVCVWQCFEGLKAYYGDDGKIRLFRPMENMMRLSRSAETASLPVSQFLQILGHYLMLLFMLLHLYLKIATNRYI